MQAGTLNKRVVIQTPTRTANEVGEAIITWVDTATVWAGITPLSARETVRHRQAQLDTTHLVSMRWTPAVTSDCRLSYTPAGEATARYLNIVGKVNPLERKRELELQCVEVAAA